MFLSAFLNKSTALDFCPLSPLSPPSDPSVGSVAFPVLFYFLADSQLV